MMVKRKHPYKRCKKCKELVRDPDNCENCANRNPLSLSYAPHSSGRKGAPTLDMIEGNDGAWGDR